MLIFSDVDPVLAENRIQGFVPQTKKDFLKFYKMNILDNFKSLTFSVRRSLQTLDPWVRIRIQTGFLNLGHQWNVLHQK